MRVLIVEDDFTSRRMLKGILAFLGDCDVAVNGEEGIRAFRLAWQEKKPYDLICMDIVMPDCDGQEALREIREFEREKGVGGRDEVKVIMISALGDPKTVIHSYYEGGATSFLVKPLDAPRLLEEVQKLGLCRLGAFSPK